MNPIQTTPPQDPDVDEETGHDDPLDNLLTQIINGFFVLTDGQGAGMPGIFTERSEESGRAEARLPARAAGPARQRLD